MNNIQMMRKVPYKRLRKLGLGSHIVAVSAPRRGHGGAHFIVQDDQAFLQELLKSGEFGLDRVVGRIFHLGCISLREVSSKAGLHVSVRRDNSVDIHVDVFPPVIGTTPTGRCRYGPGRVTAHLRHDVFPMILRRHAAGRSIVSPMTVEWIRYRASITLPSAWSSKWSLGDAAITTKSRISPAAESLKAVKDPRYCIGDGPVLSFGRRRVALTPLRRDCCCGLLSRPYVQVLEAEDNCLIG